MLAAIKASKMFNSSTRKQRILAAIQDPINVELVQQLDKYIPDELVSQDAADPQPDSKSSGDHGSNSQKSRSASKKPSRSLPTSGKPVNFHSVEDEDLGSQDSSESSSESSDGSSLPSDDDGSVASSSAIHRRKISGHANYDYMLGDVQVLLGTLNSREDTSGVTRVAVETNESSHSKELWVYYDDSVNLNNVMTLVVDSVSRYYPQFIFNRLARSNNAVVFDVCQPTAISAVAKS